MFDASSVIAEVPYVIPLYFTTAVSHTICTLECHHVIYVFSPHCNVEC
jgi:hypothetical protein